MLVWWQNKVEPNASSDGSWIVIEDEEATTMPEEEPSTFLFKEWRYKGHNHKAIEDLKKGWGEVIGDLGRIPRSRAETYIDQLVLVHLLDGLGGREHIPQLKHLIISLSDKKGKVLFVQCTN